MKFEWLGIQDYKSNIEKQKLTLDWPVDRETVWGLEHPYVLTLGRRARAEDEVQHGSGLIPVTHTDRGGLATIHGPGQLMVYPLISLRRRQWGPREYVCQLLKITRDCLSGFGISGLIDTEQSGIFVGENKICFIGLRVSGGRVYHGLSLNVSNDLSVFQSIRACGVQGRPLTSLRELGVHVGCREVFHAWEQKARTSPLVAESADFQGA